MVLSDGGIYFTNSTSGFERNMGNPLDGGSGTYDPLANQSGSVNSGNAAQAANIFSTVAGLITNTTQEMAKIPTVGYKIAYNSTLLKGVSYLKPLGYGASIISVSTDFNMSYNGQQSWTETGANTIVTAVTIGVGGWPGLIIQANYQASKLYMGTIMKHPEWAPYPIYAR